MKVIKEGRGGDWRQRETTESGTEVRPHQSRICNACLCLQVTIYTHMKEKSKLQ